MATEDKNAESRVNTMMSGNDYDTVIGSLSDSKPQSTWVSLAGLTVAVTLIYGLSNLLVKAGIEIPV